MWKCSPWSISSCNPLLTSLHQSSHNSSDGMSNWLDADRNRSYEAIKIPYENGKLMLIRQYSLLLFSIQRARDWINDFFSSLPKICDDPSDAVAAAAFSAIEALLQGHPLCVTAVNTELGNFWGSECEQRRKGVGEREGKGRVWMGGPITHNVFSRHKQVLLKDSIDLTCFTPSCWKCSCFIALNLQAFRPSTTSSIAQQSA